MNILITGGSGFIGSHVSDALTVAGHQVTILDSRTSPYLQDNQKMLVGNIMDQSLLKEAVSGMDIVYHFAGIADIDDCMVRPVDTVSINILATVMLLELCKEEQIKRFVFASSTYVYSNSGYFYRSSKQACETYIENYAKLYGLKYTCLRFGSLYGPRADWRNSIYKLIKQALEEGKITYHGTGEELREFIHVYDAAQSSVNILKPEYENQYITITGNEKMRYKDLLEMLKEMLNNNLEVEIVPATRKAHYKVTPYNFSPRLGLKMNSNPHIDMGQGLLQCVADIYDQVHLEKKSDLGVFVDE